jgi:hypothetical protein
MRFVAALIVLALFGACAGQDQLTGDRRDVGVVTVVFTATPAQVQLGQPVRFRLRLSNNGGKTEELVTPTSQLYDFWVRKGSREVWRWSSGETFIQSVTTTDLATQATQVYTQIWHPAAAGRFTVYGEIKANGYEGPFTGKVTVR